MHEEIMNEGMNECRSEQATVFRWEVFLKSFYFLIKLAGSRIAGDRLALRCFIKRTQTFFLELLRGMTYPGGGDAHTQTHTQTSLFNQTRVCTSDEAV